MGEVQFKPWSHESASHRKLTCDNLRWHQSNGVTSRHKFCTFAKYSLTFFRWYISYDSPLKRCRKEMFLLPLLTCVFPSLTISSFFFSVGLVVGLGRFGFAALAVSVGLIQNNIDFIQCIKFNASKCKVLTVTRKKSPVDFVYHLGPEMSRP